MDFFFFSPALVCTVSALCTFCSLLKTPCFFSVPTCVIGKEKEGDTVRYCVLLTYAQGGLNLSSVTIWLNGSLPFKKKKKVVSQERDPAIT